MDGGYAAISGAFSDSTKLGASKSPETPVRFISSSASSCRMRLFAFDNCADSGSGDRFAGTDEGYGPESELVRIGAALGVLQIRSWHESKPFSEARSSHRNVQKTLGQVTSQATDASKIDHEY